MSVTDDISLFRFSIFHLIDIEKVVSLPVPVVELWSRTAMRRATSYGKLFVDFESRMC